MTRLTDTAVQTYRRDGYCLIRQLIPADLVARVRDRVAAIAVDPPAWPDRHFQCLDPAYLKRADGRLQPGALQSPASQEAVFAEMANHPALQAAMAALLDGPVRLHTDQVGMKLAAITQEQGGRSYYHQDSYYWRLPPRIGCNAWIPLHPVGPDAIGLAIMPGTQADWTLLEHEHYYDDPAWGNRTADGAFRPFQRHRIPAAATAGREAEELLPTLQPGDALFFTNYTWHRSDPNRSGQDKAFYAIAYRRADWEPPKKS